MSNVGYACTVADIKAYLNGFSDDMPVGILTTDGGFDNLIVMSLVFADKSNYLQETQSSDTTTYIAFS